MVEISGVKKKKRVGVNDSCAAVPFLLPRCLEVHGLLDTQTPVQPCTASPVPAFVRKGNYNNNRRKRSGTALNRRKGLDEGAQDVYGNFTTLTALGFPEILMKPTPRRHRTHGAFKMTLCLPSHYSFHRNDFGGERRLANARGAPTVPTSALCIMRSDN